MTMAGSSASVMSVSRTSLQEHDDDDADEYAEVLDKAQDHVGEHLVERLRVVRHARHDDAHRHLVEVRQRQRLDLLEERRPEVLDHVLAREAQHERVAVGRDEVQEQHASVEQYDLYKPLERAVLADRARDGGA